MANRREFGCSVIQITVLACKLGQYPPGECMGKSNQISTAKSIYRIT
jgi:hypothetical protein